MPATVARRARAGDYRIDQATVRFTTRHVFGIAPVHGTFQLRSGHIHVTDPVDGSTARATITAGQLRHRQPHSRQRGAFGELPGCRESP
jgi:hypothetical protein